jgi:hypothetical protein
MCDYETPIQRRTRLNVGCSATGKKVYIHIQEYILIIHTNYIGARPT